MFKFATCTIAKDEREDYLREWIEWHLLSGADFVYLIDNGSKIPLRSLLSDVCNLGVGEMPGPCMQHVAYNWFISKFTGIVKWAAFIDADEFIVSKVDDIPSRLLSWLNPCPYGGMGLSWKVFGSNGLLDNPNKSQITAFTKRATNDYDMSRYIKTIAQLEFTSHVIDAHYFAYKNNYFCINEDGVPIHGSLSYPSYNSIYINHYYTRSKNDYMQKIGRGFADSNGPRGSEFDIKDPYCNSVEDFEAIDLFDKLKNKTYKKFYNEKIYLDNNQDVKDSVLKGHFNSGMEHWLIHGQHENRKCL